MSAWLIALTGAIYLYVGIEQMMKGNVDMGGVYIGYSFSNVWLYRMAL